MRLALGVILVGSVALAAGPARVGVTYASNWDDVTLEQHGAKVTGSYVCCGGGLLQGELTGRTLHYRWVSPAGGGGYGVWTLGANGRLDGTWGTANETDGGAWNLTPKTQIAN